jgi:uncharacterized protein (DUF924 family)
MPIEPADVIAYWIGDADDHPDAASKKSKLWYGSKPETDRQISKQFGDSLRQAENNELEEWKTSKEGQLALVILLDQFTRNLNRGTKAAWKNDNLALQIAEDAVKDNAHTSLSTFERVFLYHPFHHSESIEVQHRAVALFTTLQEESTAEWQTPLEKYVRFVKNHSWIIAQFGRFPHRNDTLQRETTPDEIKYLNQNKRKYGQ